MLELGVIADDLTGGMKVAALLEREGVRCPLVTSIDALEALDDEAGAVVVGRKLLAQPPQEARVDAKRTGEALLAKEVKQLYYKYSALFASTARGNIGPVAETLMAITGTDHVFFCPAFPERGATVYQGRRFLGSGMLHESPRRHDPVTPMTNSNLVEVLQAQSRVKVGLLAHGTLAAGTAACEQHVLEQRAGGVRFFIVDTIDQTDLARVAALTRGSALTTGADELPVMLARGWPRPSRSGGSRTSLPAAPGHEAVIAGSCTPKTGRQLARFEREHPVLRIDLLEAAADAGLVGRAVDWACDRLAHGPLGVATTTDRDGVNRVQHELGREGASALADAVLAAISRALYAHGVRKFVVAGGGTSGAVMESLGVDQVQVSAYDDLYGGYCHRAGPDPLSLVLKSGSVGDDDFLFVALERMRAATP